jgi:hypothetical protein
VRVPSPILNFLGANLKEGSVVDEGDNLLVIPNLIQPITLLPLPIRRLTGFQANDQASFVSAGTVGQPASTAQRLDTWGQFKRGLWWLSIDAAFCSSWTQVLDGTLGAQGAVQIVDDSVSPLGQSIIPFLAITNQPQQNRWTGYVHFQNDGWIVRTFLALTGVGQTHTISIGLYAARIT